MGWLSISNTYISIAISYHYFTLFNENMLKSKPSPHSTVCNMYCVLQKCQTRGPTQHFNRCTINIVQLNCYKSQTRTYKYLQHKYSFSFPRTFLRWSPTLERKNNSSYVANPYRDPNPNPNPIVMPLASLFYS